MSSVPETALEHRIHPVGGAGFNRHKSAQIRAFICVICVNPPSVVQNKSPPPSSFRAHARNPAQAHHPVGFFNPTCKAFLYNSLIQRPTLKNSLTVPTFRAFPCLPWFHLATSPPRHLALPCHTVIPSAREESSPSFRALPCLPWFTHPIHKLFFIPPKPPSNLHSRHPCFNSFQFFS